METNRQRCARLASALDDLAAQEEIAVAAADFAVVAELQARSAPLIDFLVANAVPSDGGDLRARIAHVSARRAATALCLARQMARARDELRELVANQRRVAQVAPAYRTGASASEHRLVAVG